MKYVIDASVAIKWALDEEDSEKAAQLLDNYRSQVDSIHAPDFFVAEYGHALTRAERRGILAVGEARNALAAVLIDCPILHDSTALASRAAEISGDLRMGFYDATYIALAEREACALITADARLVRNAKRRFSFLVELSTLP